MTVTSVDTAPNLRRAVVYYGVIGSEEQVEGTPAALEAAAPRISAIVGSQVRMKFTPTLTFAKDESLERSARITSLLREVSEESDEDA